MPAMRREKVGARRRNEKKNERQQVAMKFAATDDDNETNADLQKSAICWRFVLTTEVRFIGPIGGQTGACYTLQLSLFELLVHFFKQKSYAAAAAAASVWSSARVAIQIATLTNKAATRLKAALFEAHLIAR